VKGVLPGEPKFQGGLKAPFEIFVSCPDERLRLSWSLFGLKIENPMSSWWLYICDKQGKMYIGITTDLANRLKQHQNPKLLYKEGPLTREKAVAREKQIKGWRREKKLELIAKGPGKPR
jgi:putative endonuclease